MSDQTEIDHAIEQLHIVGVKTGDELVEYWQRDVWPAVERAANDLVAAWCVLGDSIVNGWANGIVRHRKPRTSGKGKHARRARRG